MAVKLQFNIGDKVQITTNWSEYRKAAAMYVQRIYTDNGTVIKSQPFDDVDTVRLATSDINFPESVVAFKYITGIKVNDNIVDFNYNPAIKDGIETWQVAGSKPGNIYTVTRNGTNWNCTCSGYQFRSKCKHTKEKQENVL